MTPGQGEWNCHPPTHPADSLTHIECWGVLVLPFPSPPLPSPPTLASSSKVHRDTPKGGLYIRGRQSDGSESFNQLWSVEEQAKLEYLLKVFPSEQKEIRRWEKIAKALGNRTAKQVLHSLSALLHHAVCMQYVAVHSSYAIRGRS